ncbi:MAG: hypothetical protein ABSD28_04930 [Tepidisphaeraceae bacterium]|jgi:hypothetical protein
MKKRQSGEDAKEAAARVVKERIAQHSNPLPTNLQASREQWSAGIQKVDARGMA